MRKGNQNWNENNCLSSELIQLKNRLDDVSNEVKESFNKLRGQIGGLTKEKNKLIKENDDLTIKLVSAREELIKTKNKIKFIESKLPKKTLEEIVAYTFSQKEVLKRSKNDRKD